MKLADDTTPGGRRVDHFLLLGLGILILGPRSGYPGSEWCWEAGLLLMAVGLMFRLAWEIRQRRELRGQ